MDVTSPFFVVPLLAITFLTCILTASLTGKPKAHASDSDDSHTEHGTH